MPSRIAALRRQERRPQADTGTTQPAAQGFATPGSQAIDVWSADSTGSLWPISIFKPVWRAESTFHAVWSALPRMPIQTLQCPTAGRMHPASGLTLAPPQPQPPAQQHRQRQRNTAAAGEVFSPAKIMQHRQRCRRIHQLGASCPSAALSQRIQPSVEVMASGISSKTPPCQR